jgi:hypothetical protein
MKSTFANDEIVLCYLDNLILKSGDNLQYDLLVKACYDGISN